MYRLRLDPLEDRISYPSEDEYIKAVDAFLDIVREGIMIDPFTSDTDISLLTHLGTRVLLNS